MKTHGVYTSKADFDEGTMTGVTLTDNTVSGGTATALTSLGTATGSTVGFFGTTPIVQRTGAAQAAVTSTSPITCTIGGWGYDTQTQAAAIVTLVNELRAALIAYGLITGAA